MKRNEIWWTNKIIKEFRAQGLYATRTELIHEPGFPDALVSLGDHKIIFEVKMKGEDFTRAQKGWWKKNGGTARPALVTVCDGGEWFMWKGYGFTDCVCPTVEDLVSHVVKEHL